MPTETVTLQIPKTLYQRLVYTARATQRPLEEVMLYALQVGSPPAWDDVPEEFQADLAALDKLDDKTLWQIAHSRKRLELTALRQESDLFMLRKAQAAVLLRWRGHSVPAA